MKKIKGFSFVVLGILVVLSSIFFVGCKADKDYEDLFVFATLGGKVQVNTTEEVAFGDEGKKFTFEENSNIELKAIADTGYKFVKWEYTDVLNEQPEGFSTQAEITITLEDEVVIRAVFEVDANEKFDISYTSSGEGYNIVAEEGYDTSVVVGSTFKFKVELDEEYSNSALVVAYNGITIQPGLDDVYTIENIAEDIVIIVDNVKKNEYIITLPTSADYTITVAEGYNANAVVYGNDFKFSIDVDDKYESYAVKCNDTLINAEQGVYTISNIMSNCVITVELGQVKPTIYNVSKNVGSAGYNIVANSMSVTAGETFEFGVDVLEGYVQDETSGIMVIANNGDVEVEKNPDGTYYIENVNQNIVISVSGVLKLETYIFNFTFENAELWEMIAGGATNIPEGIRIVTVSQTESKTYDINTFEVKVLNEQGTLETVTMIDLINGIKEDLSNLAYSELIGFKYADSDFITFNDEFVTINWGLLNAGFEHEVIVITAPIE